MSILQKGLLVIFLILSLIICTGCARQRRLEREFRASVEEMIKGKRMDEIHSTERIIVQANGNDIYFFYPAKYGNYYYFLRGYQENDAVKLSADPIKKVKINQEQSSTMWVLPFFIMREK